MKAFLIKTSSLWVLLSLGIHSYLSFIYYSLHFRSESDSFTCNINEVFNCSSVALSPYSHIFSVPVSLFGVALHGVLLWKVLTRKWGWDSSPYYLQDNLGLSFLSLLASFVMGGISLIFMKVHCIFCLSLYVLSILVFSSFYFEYKNEESSFLKSWISSLIERIKTPKDLISYISIPAIVFLSHFSIYSSLDGGKMDRMNRFVISDWSTLSSHTFSSKASLEKGGSGSFMEVVEFADFRCIHCKKLAPKLKSFLLSHPQVKFKFYNYPLDKKCNSGMPSSMGFGISCLLAKTVHCSAEQKKGWLVHDFLFENQEALKKYGDSQSLKDHLKEKLPQMGLVWSSLESCILSPQTDQIIRAQVQDGDEAGVQGTPSVFVNGKRVGGLSPQVFKMIYQKLNQ